MLKNWWNLFLLIIIFKSCYTQGIQKLEHSISSDTIALYQKSGLSHFDVTGNGKKLLLLYQSKQNQIALIDLEKKIQTGILKLEKFETMKPETGTLQSFRYVNPEKIIFLYEYRLIIADSALNIKYSKIINDPDSDEWPPVVYANFGKVFPVQYDSLSGEIIIRQHCGICGNHDSFFNTNTIATFNPESDTFTDLGIPFPDIYKKGKFLGDALHVFGELKGDSIIIGFNADSYITIFNRKTGNLSRISAKSKFQQQEIQYLEEQYRNDINKRVEHLTLSPLYFKIMYDPYRNLYYRFYKNGVPLRNKDGTYNTFSDKDLIVMVLDSTFKIISEINLGKGYLWHFSFIRPGGLYILKDQHVSDSITTHLYGHKIAFDIINFYKK